MSKGGSGGTQTQTSKVQLPDWVNEASQQNYWQAKYDAQNLMGPYTGQRVADMPAGATNLINQLYGNVGSTNPAFTNASATTNALMGFNPSTVTPQTLAGTNLAPYMNPYTQSVIDPSMQLLEQQRKQSLNQIGDQAVQSKAFGGSRQGVAEGVTNAQSALQAGQLGAQLYGQNFQQAQQAAGQDITNNYNAQLANAQLGLSGAQFQGSMAQQLGNLAQQGQANWLTGVNAAMGGQQMLQQQQQAQLDAARQQYAEQQQFPLQQLQIVQNALGMSPYGQTTQTTAPGPSTDPLGQVLGTGSSLLGMAGMAKYLGFLSDRKTKTDIEKLGKDKATGLDMYAFRYKNDPKSYPKVVGPMAQDVEKKFPGATRRIGSHLALNSYPVAA